MKKIKFILSILVILIGANSCEKENLEDTARGNQLLGKWKYEYGGYHTNSSNFVSTTNPFVDYEIEFLEGAKISINREGVIEEFRIRKFNELTNKG